MSTAVAYSVPLLAGKTDQDREAMRSCWLGERRNEFAASRRRLGIVSESVWIQGIPGGDVAVVHLVADDLESAFKGVGTSQEPFDQWFRQHCIDVHGIDLAMGFTPPEQVLDFRA
jgi:hypothetical protein